LARHLLQAGHNLQLFQPHFFDHGLSVHFSLQAGKHSCWHLAHPLHFFQEHFILHLASSFSHQLAHFFGACVVGASVVGASVVGVQGSEVDNSSEVDTVGSVVDTVGSVVVSDSGTGIGHILQYRLEGSCMIILPFKKYLSSHVPCLPYNSQA